MAGDRDEQLAGLLPVVCLADVAQGHHPAVAAGQPGREDLQPPAVRQPVHDDLPDGRQRYRQRLAQRGTRGTADDRGGRRVPGAHHAVRPDHGDRVGERGDGRRLGVHRQAAAVAVQVGGDPGDQRQGGALRGVRGTRSGEVPV